MASEGYELLALLMRYVFVALGALIVWCAFRWMRKDARNYKRQMRRLPDAGLIGEVVNLNTGERLPLPREGIMGSSISCDVRVRGNGVGRKHVLFSFAEGKGLRLTPCGRKRFVMEDVEMSGTAYALHGTQIDLGDVALRVRLFAGLNVPHLAAFEAPETEEEAFAEDSSGFTEEAFGALSPDYPFRDEPMSPVNEWRGDSPAEEPPIGEDDPEADQGIPYQSPLPQRHRRSRRL